MFTSSGPISLLSSWHPLSHGLLVLSLFCTTISSSHFFSFLAPSSIGWLVPGVVSALIRIFIGCDEHLFCHQLVYLLHVPLLDIVVSVRLINAVFHHNPPPPLVAAHQPPVLPSSYDTSRSQMFLCHQIHLPRPLTHYVPFSQ